MAAPRSPSFEDIQAAAKRIASHAVRTPLLESPFLNDRLGGRVFIKPEMFQRTGSFKFRGAFNRIVQLDPKSWPGGVVTCSSGNHAQGVAEAARLKGIKAAIVMPSDAPKLKIARTKRSGGEVITFARGSEDREAIAARIAEERKCVFVAPYDDPDVIAGQGTMGVEIVEQARARGAELDYVLAPTGGGGLISGVALAVTTLLPDAQVYAVEPEGFNDLARSLASGKRERNSALTGSICDALLTPTPGAMTFEINRKRLKGAFEVSDAEVRQAVRFAFEELKLVVEPGGAVALAALLSGRLALGGKTAAIVLSGGNIDGALLAEILAEG